MTWTEFVAALVDSLAWPAAVVTLGVVFRRPILSATRLILKIGGAELSLDIAQELATAERTAAGLPSPPVAFEAQRQLATTDPAAAVDQAFRLVVDEVRAFAARRGDEVGFLSAVQYILSHLSDEWGGDDDLPILMPVLWQLWSQSRNQPDAFDGTRAAQYVGIAERVAGTIRLMT